MRTPSGRRMQPMRNFCATGCGRDRRLTAMSKLDAHEVTRTLTIVLPESEWQALRHVEPDAIGWLQDRIREGDDQALPAGALHRLRRDDVHVAKLHEFAPHRHDSRGVNSVVIGQQDQHGPRSILPAV